MVLDTAANFVRSDVDSQVASGSTTVSVVNASPFPDPSTSTPYNCVLWDASLGSPYQDSDVEIVRVTAVDYTNNDLTVTRAQESTADVSHPSTSAIQLSPTAKMMSDVDSSLETIADFTTNEVTADVNNSTVTTDESTIGNPRKPQITNGDKTLNVPGDYPTIQAALDAIPRLVRHRWIIEVDNGTYDEDLFLSDIITPSCIKSSTDPYSEQGGQGNLSIVGDPSTPSNVQVNSITVSGVYAVGTEFLGFELTGENPYTDDPSQMMVNGCRSVKATNCRFAGYSSQQNNKGIVYYQSGGKVRLCDFPNNNLHSAVGVKRGGFVDAVDLSGTVQNYAYNVSQGGVITYRLDDITAPDVASSGGGYVINNDTGLTHWRTNTGASAYLSTTQTLSHATLEQINFDATQFDHRGGFDTSTGEYTVTNPGTYAVELNFAIGNLTDTAEMIAQIKVNGSKVAVKKQNVSTKAANREGISGASKHLELAEGDVVTGYAYQRDNDTTSKDLSTGLSKTYLTINQIG